jgi:hypothetical protein
MAKKVAIAQQMRRRSGLAARLTEKNIEEMLPMTDASHQW